MTRAVCLLALLAGVAWNVRFAIADLAAGKNLAQATRLAMRLIPENPSYAAQLADEVYAQDPVAAKSLLERAVRQNRYDAAHWIQLGLLAEGADDLPRAETALLEAAKVDATFLPSWSLANFYFRQNLKDQPDRFWFWAQKAAHMAPDDAAPLFRLALYATPDVGEVEQRLQITGPAMAGQFINFLIRQGDAAAVAQAAARLVGSDSQALAGICDWLIAQRRPDLALPLWNAMVARGQPPVAQLRAVTGAVTNGGFRRSPLSQGFDWRLQTVEGVSTYLNTNPDALGFEFSGEQGDGLMLIRQTVAVQAQEEYVLAVDYSTANIAPGTGVMWQVTDERSDAVLASTGSLAAQEGGQATACFTAPEGDSFVNLSLAYQRQPGTMRVEGKLTLRRVQLTAGPCPRPGPIPGSGSGRG